MAVERDQRGRYLPGHNGNPGGRPKGLATYIQELRGLKPHHRLEAANWLADRGWGKATQAVEIAHVTAAPGEIDWGNIPIDLAERSLALHNELVALQPGCGGLLVAANGAG